MTDLTTTPRVLILPGWADSGPEHWQSRWMHQHGYAKVEQHDWITPKRGDWMARLEEVVLQSPTPALLVAHSLGCHLVAAWARHSAQPSQVVGALLVAPPDLERADLPPTLCHWRPPVRERLPFPSIAVISDDDPFGAADRVVALAKGWGSEVVHIGSAGHINSESNLGDWPAGHALLQRLVGRRA